MIAAFARRWPWWPTPFPLAGAGSRRAMPALPDTARGPALPGHAPASPTLTKETAHA
jgi:hypothetical protein